MELETIKNKIAALKQEEKTQKDEIDRLSLEKLQAEQKAQSLQEDLSLIHI